MIKKLPTVSIIIPTLNAASTLKECLKSVVTQDYPRKLIKIIIVDGGSDDQTIKIAKKYGDLVLLNPDKIHPLGRVIGIRASRDELILCLDADNVLETSSWLRLMVSPLVEDRKIIASEPIRYSLRSSDSLISQYCSLIGGDDPVLIYLGAYERFSYLTNQWLETPAKIEEQESYFKVQFTDPNSIPPLGANGFLVRRNALTKVNYNPFLHVDVCQRLIESGFDTFAKVKLGIIHAHAESFSKFVRKKSLRVARRFDFGVRSRPEYMYRLNRKKATIFALKILLVFPLFIDAFRGFLRKPSPAWVYHPLSVLTITFVYGLSLGWYSIKKLAILIRNL